jgi:uncharacterized membrane protein YsdA (DUF1294 family)
MINIEQLLIVYAIINAVTFYIYGIDKLKAQEGRYRIPEKILITLALFGPIGGILGMKLFRHKTKKTKFKILVPTFLVIHVCCVLFYTNVYASEGPSDWAREEYNEAVSKGYITDDLKTELQSSITRQEFVELIIESYEVVMGEIVNITEADNPFSDTESMAVVKAYKMGIVTGVSQSNFAPAMSINREQMIVIFVRMNRAIEQRSEEAILKYRNIDLEYEDSSEVSNWAVESFQIGVHNALVSGVGNNNLGPKMTTSKEQAVIMNLRLMNHYESNNHLLGYIEETNNTFSKNMNKETGFVTVDILNMRSTPNLSSPDNIIRKLNLYEQVSLLEKDGLWYHIQASGGIDGYVYTEYVRIDEPNTDESASVDNIVDYAKQFQGTPYLYSGTSLTQGIDCSAYTQQVMVPYGINLSRSSSGQYSNGISVAVDDLRVGDLVYYGYSGRVSHVAIYIGNNQVIHANTTFGVSITPAFGWMHKPVIGYRRVVL